MESGNTKAQNITTLGTVVIPLPANPTGKLILKSILIGTKGASSNTLTVYDSNPTLGANAELKKATIDTTVLPGEFDFEDLIFFNGIYIVCAAGTAPDATVLYCSAV